MLTRLTVVIFSQYLQIFNHVAHLKLIQCYMSVYLKKGLLDPRWFIYIAPQPKKL